MRSGSFSTALPHVPHRNDPLVLTVLDVLNFVDVTRDQEEFAIQLCPVWFECGNGDCCLVI